jgi:putative flavoprotein involved in K+ transport
VATARGVIRARNVVVATGPFQAPKIPVLSRELPSGLFQMHSRDYRNPVQLPPGAALVVGSGASGTQIAEELHHAGRKVILAVGRFHKTPRRYRGRDFYWWFDKLGYWHTPLASLPPDIKKLRFVVTAVDGGHDVDLRQYASDGIVLAGRLKSADQQKIVFHDDLERTLMEGEAWYDEFRRQMDEYADKCDPPLPAEPIKPTSSQSENGKQRGVLELDIRRYHRSCGQPAISAIFLGSSYQYWMETAIPSMNAVSPNELDCFFSVSGEPTHLDRHWSQAR